MARIFEYEPATDQEAMHGDLPNGILWIAQQDVDPGLAPVTSPQGETSVAAAGDCAITDEQTVLRLPVLQNDGQADGQDLEIVSVTQPASGRAVVAEDGIISFVPDQPGHQEIAYLVRDASGALSEAKVHVFVNPDGGAIAQPVLEGADSIALAHVARTCVDGMALDVARLAGDRVVIDPPDPGQRVQVTAAPGQQIEIQDAAFVQATFMSVDGGLLLISGDGRMIFLDGFAEAAAGPNPATLSIDGSTPVSAQSVLDAALKVEDIETAAGPAPNPPAPHGGGASFALYNAGGIGDGLEAIGPQAPTALTPGGPEIIFESPLDSELSPQGDDIDPSIPGNPGGPANQPPTISISATIDVEIGEVTSGGANFINAPAFPELSETRGITAPNVNGVDSRNLAIGSGGDAAIIFRDEIALFKNSVGVYLIGENGEMLDPKLAFFAVEHADPLFDENGIQQFAFIRPGGGPLSPGDQVLLSELYPDQTLEPGSRFGVFLVADGGGTGQITGNETFSFRNADGDIATVFDGAPPIFFADNEPIDISVYHAADPDAPDGSSNDLNPDGKSQTVSGLVRDGAGLTIAFEDVERGLGDDDFNDAVIDVLPIPSAVSSLPFVKVDIAIDATVADADDVDLTRAVVEISAGAQPGDSLALTAPLDGTGIILVEDGSGGRLVLEGRGSIADYEAALRGLQFGFGTGDGEREISFRVVDLAGNTSNTEIVTISPSALAAEIGTDGADTLAGADGVDNAIAGRGGDDSLFGGNRDDVIDGGLGRDVVFGGAGDDLLIGGPGADVIDGGAGADEHRYFSIIERGDRIEGFNAEDGDVLHLGDLLGNDEGSGDIQDFVRFDRVGSDVEVGVDIDGTGSDAAFIPYVTLVDPAGITTIEEAASNGTVVA